MKFNNIVISAMAHYLPENSISSIEIEQKLSPIYKKLKLPHGRLELMTGIKERRFWEKGTRPSDLSTTAAHKLFDNNKIKKEDIDLIIHSSVCRDFLEPSTASVVHNNLRLNSSAMFFDLSNACLGLISSIVVASNMIENGAIKHALIVSGENGGPLLTETIDFLLKNSEINRKTIKKYIASLTIGSAAVAFTISHRDYSEIGHQILGGASLSDTTANVLCQGDGNTNSLMMETDSEQLMKHGVELAVRTWDNAKINLNWQNDDLNFVIGHQVGIAHEKMTLESLKLAKCKTFTTYQSLGNTGSAALPVTLSMASENGLLKSGDNLGLLGIGSGLSSIMLGVKW